MRQAKLPLLRQPLLHSSTQKASSEAQPVIPASQLCRAVAELANVCTFSHNTDSAEVPEDTQYEGFVGRVSETIWQSVGQSADGTLDHYSQRSRSTGAAV